ncbi:MAG: response regulator [Victivallales bacterium]|nr:response regulator [Victivallales bacterium]
MPFLIRHLKFMLMNTKILWADDEIDLLKPHILFLKSKGYDVIPAMSGMEALEILKKEFVNIIFLDENMPGLSGLETLQLRRHRRPRPEERRPGMRRRGTGPSPARRPVRPRRLQHPVRRS